MPALPDEPTNAPVNGATTHATRESMHSATQAAETTTTLANDQE